MTKAYVTAALAVVLASGLPALGQDDEGRVQITDIRLYRSEMVFLLVPFDPDTDRVKELDIIRIEVDVTDTDLPDEEFFYQAITLRILYDSYFAPEPPPLIGTTTTLNFAPASYFITGETSATIIIDLQVPLFTGVNQARLRGFIDWDVAFFPIVAIWDEEDDDEDNPAPRFGFPIYAVEDPELRPANPPPFSDAGADVTVQVGSTIDLDGFFTFDAFNIGFDPTDPEVFEKDDLVYSWEWITGPQQVDPIYRDPDQPWQAEVTLNVIGTYTYRLIVDDGVNSIPSTDSVVIDVVSIVPENQAPTAVIIAPTAPVIVGSIVSLDGTSSSDPDGDRLTYRWRQTDEVGGVIPAGDFADLFQPLSGLEDPILNWQAVRPGEYYFQLLVDDGQAQDASEIVLVEIVPAQAAGYTVQTETLGGPAPSPGGAAEPSASPLLGPAACGATFMPFAILPLLLWPLRGRIR
ncbi:MAG: hypothetical protein ABIG44_04485 [Planctomycetota bacterium]